MQIQDATGYEIKNDYGVWVLSEREAWICREVRCSYPASASPLNLVVRVTHGHER